VRQSRLLRDAGKLDHREAGFLGRFHDSGVAHGKGRTEAASDDLHRIVPGNDMGGHAVRLIQRDCRESRPVGDGIAVNLVGCSTIEFEVARQRLDVGARLLERLADVPCFELRQQIDILQDALACAMQDATTVGRRHASPVAGQRRPSCLDRALDVLAAAAGNVGKMRTVRRIQDRETTSIGGIDPAAGDVVAISPFGFRQDALQGLILLQVVQEASTKFVSTKFVFTSIRNASRVPTRQAQPRGSLRSASGERRWRRRCPRAPPPFQWQVPATTSIPKLPLPPPAPPARGDRYVAT